MLNNLKGIWLHKRIEKKELAKRIIIAGGGTGGHIFPAIAIANALKEADEETEILFVGARKRMEMEKVPQAGYKIVGLDIVGLNRSSLIKNFGLPYKLIRSFLQVRHILREFRPDAVIGVGGYSSYPVLRMAQAKGIPSFIHESNSFAGKSNKMLGKKATRVFTGTDGMENFFPAEKIMVTGNPVRANIENSVVSREEGIRFFSLDPSKTTVLVVGGSLGARAINEAVDKGMDQLLAENVQLIWQTGKQYAEAARKRAEGKTGVWTNEFISNMEHAYAAADMVIARSGAMTVAELCVVKKPVLFVPFPYAAEDHQTVNAKRLVDKNAALMLKNENAGTELIPATIKLLRDPQKMEQLKNNISKLAIRNADRVIAAEILRMIG
jgi:UDP-N-acetylglucosamine--N-acetylmuramyl-(pentapeptide) pyrophosphoryl-undecaprenol N-acetylglucosamine transferase